MLAAMAAEEAQQEEDGGGAGAAAATEGAGADRKRLSSSLYGTVPDPSLSSQAKTSCASSSVASTKPIERTPLTNSSSVSAPSLLASMPRKCWRTVLPPLLKRTCRKCEVGSAK